MTAIKMEEIELGKCAVLDKIKDCFSLYWNSIRNNLYPKQRYLYKVIPVYEAEKSQLLEDLVFAILVEFIENDSDRFRALEESVQSDFLDCYEWIKIKSVEEQLAVDQTTDEYHNRLSHDQNATMADLSAERLKCINLRESLDRKNNLCLCKVIGLRHHMTW